MTTINLKDLRAKPDTITLSNGLELEVYSMSVSDSAEYAQLLSEKKLSEAMKFLIFTTVKRALPEASDEDIDFLNKEDVTKITRAALKANGMAFEEDGDDVPNPQVQPTSEQE